MSKARVVLLGAAGCLAMTGMFGGSAAAATGQVTVFETELQALTTYENPNGCYKLPLAAHVLTNETEEIVRVYADPFCAGPGVSIKPGYGSHVAPGSGSFSV